MAEAMFRDLGVSELGPELTGEHGVNHKGLSGLTTFNGTENRRAALSADMLGHVDSEAFLIAGHSAALVSERALEEEIKTEKFLRKPIEEQMHGLISKIKAQHLKNEAQRRSLTLDKSKIAMLQMRIKDLSDVMGTASHRQHKIHGQCREVEGQIRGRNRELQDYECENERLAGNLDTKCDQIRRLKEEMENNMDLQIREKNRAEVQAIAIGKDVSGSRIASEPLSEQCVETSDMEMKLANDLNTFKTIEGETRHGLKRCIANNEASNEELTDQLIVKAKACQGIARSLHDVTKAKDSLHRDIADKDKINLTFELDTHTEREGAVDVQKRLSSKDGEVAELLQAVSMAKSQSDVLAAKLEHEQATMKRMAQWTENETINAEKLETDLQRLKMNEGHGSLRKAELGAQMRQQQQVYDNAVDVTRKVFENVHKARFQEGYSRTLLKRQEAELLEEEDKLAIKSALTEKAYQALKSQEALSSQRLASIAAGIASITERVEIKSDEVHRVGTRLRVSEDTVKSMQSTIEEAAEEAGASYLITFREHTRLDSINVELQDRYRQIKQHNAIAEEALVTTNGRIDFASHRMEKLAHTAAQFVKLNQEEIDHLELRYNKETITFDSLLSEQNQNDCRRKAVVGEFDAACHKHRQNEIQLRNARNETEYMNTQLELQKEKQLDAEKMVDMMASENTRNKDLLALKTGRCDKATKKLLNYQGSLTELEEGLHFAETKILQLYSQQKVDDTEIHGLEHDIRISAETHSRDQGMVQIKMDELSKELSEKESVIQKLNNFKKKMEETEHILRERLMQAEKENARRARTYSTLLDGEQQNVSRIRALNERMSKEIMAMRDSQLEMEEEKRLLEAKNSAVMADHEALISEVYRLDRQTQVASIATQRLTIKEGNQAQLSADLQEDLAELTLKKVSHQFSERDLKRLIQEVEEDNRILREQAASKEREDRALLLMIGKEKMHVDRNGHGNAGSQDAERSMQKLLQADNSSDSPIGRTDQM